MNHSHLLLPERDTKPADTGKLIKKNKKLWLPRCNARGWARARAAAVPALRHGQGQSWGKRGWEPFTGDIVQLRVLRQSELNINFKAGCFLKKQEGWDWSCKKIAHCAARLSSVLLSRSLWSGAIPGCPRNRTCFSCSSSSPSALLCQLHPACPCPVCAGRQEECCQAHKHLLQSP